ncbi:DUF1624 domain-containing protein [Rhizobium sp. TH2]|uniref:heparan-alpha-glucosaminide N-acetyltransferase n=1 Tax=Rhizobium sp. TH2 TaxID=2775403 RepID=UPI0021572D16|nr:heparan-alpha-glucosaminide N-acetyltransferase [Rhizobium sp. TH2]UVC11299.1 DUF1624 domain-containing protein [Rhizobium sp. TH2]
MTETASPEKAPTGKRIAWLDILRGAALIAMASYHFLWDLSDFGYLEPGYPSVGWPRIYARVIASTFLFLAGFSLVLAHRNGIRWNVFWIRFGKIIAAAVLVTVASYFAIPQGLIFFGILHAIALFSLVGLIFLRVNPIFAVLAAALAFVAPLYLKSDAFNDPWFWWLGLSTKTRTSFDYVPLLPWICPFLLGMAASRLDRVQSLLRQYASGDSDENRLRTAFSFLGRHSLVFYLVHQPILISMLFGFSLIYPPDPAAGFVGKCEADCRATLDAQFCTRFCGCALDELQKQNLFTAFQSGAISPADSERIDTLRIECTARSE